MRSTYATLPHGNKDQQLKWVNSHLKRVGPRVLKGLFPAIRNVPCSNPDHYRSAIKWNFAISANSDLADFGVSYQQCFVRAPGKHKLVPASSCIYYHLAQAPARADLDRDHDLAALLRHRDSLLCHETSARAIGRQASLVIKAQRAERSPSSPRKRALRSPRKRTSSSKATLTKAEEATRKAKQQLQQQQKAPTSKDKRKEQMAELRRALGVDQPSSPSLSPIPSHVRLPKRPLLRRQESSVYGDMYLRRTATASGSSSSGTLFSPMRGASPPSIPSSAGYNTGTDSSLSSYLSGEPQALLRAGKRLLRADSEDDVRQMKRVKVESPSPTKLRLMDAVVPSYAIHHPPSPSPPMNRLPTAYDADDTVFTRKRPVGAVQCLIFTETDRKPKHIEFWRSHHNMIYLNDYKIPLGKLGVESTTALCQFVEGKGWRRRTFGEPLIEPGNTMALKVADVDTSRFDELILPPIAPFP